MASEADGIFFSIYFKVKHFKGYNSFTIGLYKALAFCSRKDNNSVYSVRQNYLD